MRLAISEEKTLGLTAVEILAITVVLLLLAGLLLPPLALAKYKAHSGRATNRLLIP